MGREGKSMNMSTHDSYLFDTVSFTQRDSLHEVPSGWLATTKNEQPCLRCRRNFWAWDTGRACCYLCDPPDPVETQRILGSIGATLPNTLPRKDNGTNGKNAIW